MSLNPPPGLDPGHTELFQQAVKLLSTNFVSGRHEVSTAFLLSTGHVVLGMHFEGSCGRSSICAEGMALGASVLVEGATVQAVVAVLYIVSTGQIRMIAPCGVCRELLFDYAPAATCYTWSSSSVKSRTGPPSRDVDQRGFDLDCTTTAEGSVTPWIVKDLLPEKSRRSGW
jgi:cytidine deaminase